MSRSVKRTAKGEERKAEIMKSISRTLRGLQWQLALTIAGASVVVCLVLMGIRVINAAENYSSVRSSSVVAGAARQLITNPRFRDFSVSYDEEGDIPRMPVPIDFGSMLRDMQIDLRYFPQGNMILFYIDESGNVTPLNLQRPRVPGEGAETEKDFSEIIKSGIELAEESPFEQVVVTEADHSMALVPHTDPKTGKQGYFFLYMTDPEFSNLVRPILRSSARELAVVMLVTWGLGMIIGFIFSRRWTKWFKSVSAVMKRWTEGDFTRRVDSKEIMSVREWEILAERLNDMSDRLEEVMETNQKLAVSEERNKISRELHDSVKQQLFSINMNLGAAQMLQEKNPESAAEKVKLAGEITRDALLELDLLIGTIRPNSESDGQLMRNLRRYLKTWEDSCDIRLKTQVEDAAKVRDESIGSAILRICQEALSNVSRHSEAKNAEVTLEADELEIRLTISDDGKGFDAANCEKNIGLNSMRERAEGLNGSFEISSRPGKSIIHVRIPQPMNV